WVIGLVFTNRAGFGLKTRDQAERCDREGDGTELRVRYKKVAQFVERWVMEPGQSYVRSEFARLRRQSDTDQSLLDLVAQAEKFGARLDHRQRTGGLSPPAEYPRPGNLQREAARP